MKCGKYFGEKLVHEKGEGDTSKKEIVIPFLTVG